VMGFCTPEEYDRFMQQTPIFEQMLIDDGIMLRKYWFSVSDSEQLRRFRSRHRDPVRRWKLSPMDVESINRWEDYSRAKDAMMVYTDTPTSPWFVVESDIKKHARLNMIAHLLSSIPYAEVPAPDVELPRRLTETSDYQRPPREEYTYVPDHASTLLGDPEAAR
jgi:polyphosphate kinase